MKKNLFDRMKRNLQREGWTPKGIMALLVFGAIVVVFVFFGYSSSQKMGVGAAAQVNSTLISAAEFRNESQRLEQMYAPMFGGNFGGAAQRQFLQQQALESLISGELMAQGAERLGIRATDKEIRDIIVKDIPAFQEDGRFQRDRYLAVLEANRWTAGDFERRVRKDRQTQRFRRLIEDAATPLTLEVQKMKGLRESKRNVEFVRLDQENLSKSVPVPDSEVQKRLADEGFAQKVKAEFESKKAQLGSEEQVKASHILIKTDPAKPESEKAALERIQKIQERLKKEDFGKVAAEVSEDAGSKTTKGDLGFFTRERMVPEFSNAAFSLKTGEVSAPVKSQFGYHLIKVTDRKPAVEASLEAHRNRIAREMIARERSEELLKKLEAALESGDRSAIEAAVRELGGKWQETGFFELGAESAPQLGSPVATQAALEVSEKQPYPKRVVRDAGEVFLVRWKADKREPLPAGENLAETVARERSFDLLNQWLEQQKKDAHIVRNPEALRSM